MSETVSARWPVVAALGFTQTVAWASSYYLIAFLAPAMQRDLGVGATSVFGAFSASLLISATVGPKVGRTIDRLGGRGVLAGSNLLFAAGLATLAMAPSMAVFLLGWAILGLAMGLGLYDAAFATLGRLYGAGARSSITGITLIAGFASTVGWPLTAFGEAHFGWRATCGGWALAHLILCLPVNLACLPQARVSVSAAAAAAARGAVRWDRAMVLLAFAFSLAWMVSSAIAAHLPALLRATGASPGVVLTAGALIGPAQVAARLFEATLMRGLSPLVSARVSTICHPLGAAALLLGGAAFAGPFALLHGAGNGILTIARGTVPMTIFGPENYGYRLGLIGAPSRILQAAAPLLFGYAVERWGEGALLATTGMCAAATLALFAVRARV